MNEKTYVNELKKDINIIKKDLRAISIKTRIIARELEIEDPKKKKTKKINKQHNSWFNNLIFKIKKWFYKNK
jgi:hypothetical protein